MNWIKACNILELSDVAAKPPLDKSIIKTQYKKLALKWHPDKCKDPTAAEKYCEIKSAYDYLLESQDKHAHAKSHVSAAMDFFETLYNNKEFQRSILKPLLNRIVAMCETKAGEFIDGLDVKQAKIVLSVLEQNRDILNLSSDFFEKRKCADANVICEHIILNPSLSDLLELNVYRMKRDTSYIYVPLWVPSNIFDNGLVVHCLPDLPDNIWIDEDNGLHVEQQCLLKNIWVNGGFFVDLPDKEVFVTKQMLILKEDQIVCLDGKGLPSLKKNNHCLDVGARAPLYVHLEIVFEAVDHIYSNASLYETNFFDPSMPII